MKTKPCRSYHLQITPILVASFNFKTSGPVIKPQYSFEISKCRLDLPHIFNMGPIFSWKIMKTKPCRSYHLQITPILVASFNFKTSGPVIKPQYSFEISK